MNLLLVIVLLLLSTLFVFEMKHSLNRSSVTNKLINEYAGELTGPKRQELIAKVYDYCARDRKLKKIIKKYQKLTRSCSGRLTSSRAAAMCPFLPFSTCTPWSTFWRILRRTAGSWP